MKDAVRRIYYWVHHTCRYDGNSGVQRVVRALSAVLAAASEVELVPVRWCAEREAVVRADGAWLGGLARYGGPGLPEPLDAGTPLHLAPADKGRMRGAWLLLPEVPHVGGADTPAPVLPVALDYARYYGLRTAAVFYDLIPIRVPGYDELREGHAAYARALAGADLILPISRSAGADLEAWWREEGYPPERLPRVRPLPLAGEMVGVERVRSGAKPPPPDGAVRILAVGTVEPRKNQLALLRAANRLRRRRPELRFRLDVVGHIHHAVADGIGREEAASDGTIRVHGFLPDEEVSPLVRNCDATAFVSLAEGYGLPVAESLWLGKPCLTSAVGSMAEIAEGGGCLLVDPSDPEAIERGFEELVGDAGLRTVLTEAACGRTLDGWGDYGRALLVELAAAPAVSRLLVIEGSRSAGASVVAGFEGAGVAVGHLHWRADSQALIPGRPGRPAEEARAGSGYLRDGWAVLPMSSVSGPAEAMRIGDAAHGLGLRAALRIEEGHVPSGLGARMLSGFDLVLFANEAERDAALDLALRSLQRTATLRRRMRVGGDAAGIIEEIAAERPRLTAAGRPAEPRRVFYWTGLTATQHFNTGIQRVTRALGLALQRLGAELRPVKWDANAGRMAPLSEAEAANLARWNGPSASPEAPLPGDLSGEWLLVPEITVPVAPPGSNPARLARGLGMRVAAVFYDMIPLKMREIYPPGTAEGFTEYWDFFAEVDIALPISWTAASDLAGFLTDRGLRLPAIVPCPLAGSLPGTTRQERPRSGPTEGKPLRILAVGTWEPRKNYPRLLRALCKARSLAPARAVELTIVGRRGVWAELDAEIQRLATEAGGVSLRDHVSDEELGGLYEVHHATAFCSWEEGFGLPVLESLWRGLPCLCHDGSAMAEVAPGGGALAVDMLDEAAIAGGIARLAGEDGFLERLGREAVARPIRDWDAYGRDVLASMARVGTAPGWPLPAVRTSAPRPLLSCAVTTYNRAHWLRHSLPRLIEAARPFGDRVEVVVCDNASTDDTPDVVASHRGTPNFTGRRNPANVGMLGNLGATARAANGAFVWVVGDDDLVLEGAIGNVLAGLEAHPEVEMAYMNYAYTTLDTPAHLSDVGEMVRSAKPIGPGGPNRRVAALRDVAALNENLFTAIYACAFRRDHALRAYGQDVGGSPFSSLLTCVPSSVYALAALADRPAWWVGQPAVVVNMNVSWLRWALLWHLGRMPDLFDEAELAGIDPARLEPYRRKHATNLGEWTRTALMVAEDAVRENISVERVIERCKHLDVFPGQVAELRAAYAEAWYANRTAVDRLPPEALFARYGVASDT